MEQHGHKARRAAKPDRITEAELFAAAGVNAHQLASLDGAKPLGLVWLRYVTQRLAWRIGQVGTVRCVEPGCPIRLLNDGTLRCRDHRKGART
jgi:hypothetical protein